VAQQKSDIFIKVCRDISKNQTPRTNEKAIYQRITADNQLKYQNNATSLNSRWKTVSLTTMLQDKTFGVKAIT